MVQYESILKKVFKNSSDRNNNVYSKTIYFNFKVLPVKQALRLPYIVSYHVKLSGINRKTFLTKDNDLSTCSMRIGFGDSITSRRESPKSLLCVERG